MLIEKWLNWMHHYMKLHGIFYEKKTTGMISMLSFILVVCSPQASLASAEYLFEKYWKDGRRKAAVVVDENVADVM